jgi:hypothetical protein
MTSFDDQTRALHAAYCEATGFRLELTMQRMFAWEPWLVAKLTPADVRDLVRHHQRLAKAKRPCRSLLFRTFVRDVEAAEEDLALIHAQRRAPVADPGKASVMAASGRTEETARRRDGETATARTAGAVAARLVSDPAAAAAAFAEFQKLKTSL